MKTMLVVALLTFATLQAASADESIRSVSEDGAVIVLDDGTIWRVEESDRVDTALWLVAESIVVVDDDTLVNVDESETAGARRIR